MFDVFSYLMKATILSSEIKTGKILLEVKPNAHTFNPNINNVIGRSNNTIIIIIIVRGHLVTERDLEICLFHPKNLECYRCIRIYNIYPYINAVHYYSQALSINGYSISLHSTSFRSTNLLNYLPIFSEWDVGVGAAAAAVKTTGCKWCCGVKCKMW